MTPTSFKLATSRTFRSSPGSGLCTRGSNGSRGPAGAGAAPVAGGAGAGVASGVAGAAVLGTGSGVGNFGWDWAHAATLTRLAAAIVASRNPLSRDKPKRLIIVSVVAR